MTTCRSKSPDVLSQLLLLPKPRKTTRWRRKLALNSKMVYITDRDSEVLDELKAQESEKAEANAAKKAKQLKREYKRLRKEENRKAKEKGKQKSKSNQTKPVSKKSKSKSASRKETKEKGEVYVTGPRG